MLRLLGLLLAAALISALLFGACVAACGVAVVSVVAEEGPNIVAPVPLMLPLAALHFVPDHLVNDEVHEHMDALEGAAVLALGPFARALEAAGDAELVRVTDGEDLVLIATEGDDLVIRVREGGDSGNRVFLRTPLRVLEDIGNACEASSDSEVRCHPLGMARSLITAARGTEIEVRDGETRVDITVW
ncbi:MAG: hypothetical protein OXI45_11955 [Acidobacteriota bacterium]|nr:hypothetical protein [Acidobacteriota bacterium]